VIWHDVEQNTDEWNALRCGKATASSYGLFMSNETKSFGEPAKRYALQIALEICNGKKAEFSFSNDDMRRGHEQEPVARMLYEHEYFVDVRNGGFFDWGNYGDSPDGLVGNDGVVEIKSVVAPTHYATLRRGSFDPSYRWQLVGHLDCTGREWVDFVSYCSEFPEEKQLIVHRLNRADYSQEIERLRARREEFIGLVQQTLKSIKEAV
jgi:hypothetical protein